MPERLLDRVSKRYLQGSAQAIRSVNSTIIDTYWDIGRYIVEYEQGGNVRAVYGKRVLDKLSEDLTLRHGRGFSRSNLSYMRKVYTLYPICEKASHKLTWSHYCELSKIDDDAERAFYYHQSINDNWSIPELKRQKKAALYLNLALSTEKLDDLVRLSEQGQAIVKAEDVVKDTYFFEFLKIPEPYLVSETDLEDRLIEALQPFLLELGKGFAYVGKQYRIVLNNTVYRVDLVFYHRILKCFVLIDLKIDDVQHYDIGQMNMYLGYFATEMNTEGDNPPIGIIMSRERDDLLVEHATYGMSSQLFVSKYQLYLPNRDELRRMLDEHLSTLDD